MFTVFLRSQEIWRFGRFFQNFGPFVLLFVFFSLQYLVGSDDGAGYLSVPGVLLFKK